MAAKKLSYFVRPNAKLICDNYHISRVIPPAHNLVCSVIIPYTLFEFLSHHSLTLSHHVTLPQFNRDYINDLIHNTLATEDPKTFRFERGYEDCNSFDRLTMLTGMIPQLRSMNARALRTPQERADFWSDFYLHVNATPLACKVMARLVNDNLIEQAPFVANELRHAIADMRNDTLVYLRTAQPLGKDELSRFYRLAQSKVRPGFEPILIHVLDPSAIGGVSMSSRNSSLDYTLKDKIDATEADLQAAFF